MIIIFNQFFKIMPIKKKMEVSRKKRLPAHMATLKYRRLQTLIKKSVEVSKLCNINLNLIIKDTKFNKITEYHTDDTVKLESIKQQLLDDEKSPSWLALRIISINSTDKFKFDSDVSECPQDADAKSDDEEAASDADDKELNI